MTTVTVDDPCEVLTKTTNENGQVYIGTEYGGEEVQLVITRQEKSAENDTNGDSE